MALIDKNLSKNDEKVLYGLVKFPDNTDKEISEKLDMVESTFTTIKNKLIQQKYFVSYDIPMLNRLGCELMGIIFSNFSYIVPLEQRAALSKRQIEKSEEIFLSIGEPEKGFSLSLSKNYTDFAIINDNRTQTFGAMKLLENIFPVEIIFPFNHQLSTIRNFFDFSSILNKAFELEEIEKNGESDQWFEDGPLINLSDNEKKVLIALIENPDATMQEIGELVDISRQSAAKIKKMLFEEKKLLKRLVVPNLKKIGFNMFAFYRLKFNPEHLLSEKDFEFLNGNSSMFFANRRFEVVIIASYLNYNDYKEDKMKKFKYLKENNLMTYEPIVRKFTYDRMEVLKDFAFGQITKKILNDKV